MAAKEEKIPGRQEKRGDHSSNINQYSNESTGVKKPDIKDLEAENMRLKEELEKSKKSREVFEAFFDNTIFSVVILDSNYNFIRVNDVYAKACSRHVSDFPGHNHFEFYPSDAKEIFDHVVRTKESYKILARPFVFPDHPEWGTTYWDWSLTPVLDLYGEVESLIFTLNDVTEHIRDQEKLAESEKRYRSIFHNSIDGIILTIPDGTILSANPSACRIFGRTEEELCSVGMNGIVDMNDPKVMVAVKERDKAGHYSCEMTYIRKDGTKFPGEVSTTLFKDKNGRVLSSMFIRDMTERKKTKKALSLSEEKFSKAFYHSHAIMVISRLNDGTFMDVNDTWADTLGYYREELLGKSAIELDIWVDIKERQEMKKQLDKYGYIRNFESKHRKKSGEIGVTLSSVDILDISGEKFLLVTAIDITKRKKAEEALRLSEDKFSKAFHQNHISMAITRLDDDTYVDVNNRWANILGYKREEMIGKTTLELGIWVEPIVRQEIKKIILEYGCIRNYEDKIIKKSGEICYFLASIDILDINGEKFSLISAVDITERKKAEEALRQSEERFNKTFESSPAFMSVYSMDRDRYLAVNSSYARRYGYPKEEIIGHSVYDLNIWVYDEERRKFWEDVNKTGVATSHEINFRIKSGEIITMLLSGTIIQINGENCMISTAIDISELRSLQKEMTRLDRLNMIGEMAAGIGHEVRNPMTTVKGFLQLYRDKNDFAKYKETFDLMVEELDRANSIITEFLSLAKNKAVDLKMQSLNKKIRAILPLIQADAMKQDKNIKLELGDIPYIKFDKNEINQVILNLVRNGLEAMPAGGILTIKTFQESDRVVLAVKDQGSGIAPEVLGKIGTPFFTTKDNGTGLGLAVCYSIAERNDARIDFDTGPEGTTFYVRFKG